MSGIKVEKIVADYFDQQGESRTATIYENGSICETEFRFTSFADNRRIDLEISLSLCGHKLTRYANLKLKDAGVFRTKDYTDEIRKILNNFQSGRIILSEHEMLSIVYDLLKREYNFPFFKTHVEIAGSIADGLAFVQDSSYRPAKIIAFEVKSDKDNFSRLKRQVESYIHLADEVYLVVQNKKIPKDLPFFVGVISCSGEPRILRRAIDVKHSIDGFELWAQMVKNVNRKVGLPLETDLKKFFATVETLKRKLIWNQFVIGFHQSYVKEYLPLTSEEKRILKRVFGVKAENIVPLDRWI
jgi:hypothetical protein